MNKCTVCRRHAAIGMKTLFYFRPPSMANSVHFKFCSRLVRALLLPFAICSVKHISEELEGGVF
jgi:hypothetical protein